LYALEQAHKFSCRPSYSTMSTRPQAPEMTTLFCCIVIGVSVVFALLIGGARCFFISTAVLFPLLLGRFSVGLALLAITVLYFWALLRFRLLYHVFALLL
jgi:hypothetical protein